MVSSVFVRFKKLAISLFDLVLIIIIFLWTRRGPTSGWDVPGCRKAKILDEPQVVL